MTQEDALFKMADALIGVQCERGSIDRYISDKNFTACLNACKEANKERYQKEILIFM